MNRNEFYTALSDYNDEHSLKHSSRPHKYLYITNTGRYVYEEPKKSRPYSTPNDYTSSNKKTPSNVAQKMANTISEQKRIDKRHGVDIDAIDSDMKRVNSMYSEFANNEENMTNNNLAKLNEEIEALEEKINAIQNAAVLKNYRSYMDSLKGNLNRVTDWAKRRGLLKDEIKHYGTKGQKWGVRHWQNADGTFNEAGKKRYFGKGKNDSYEKVKKGSTDKSGDKYGYGAFDEKDAERLEKLNKLNKKGKLSYNSKEYDELERLKGKEYYSKHPDEYARDIEHIEKFKNDIDSIKDDGYEFDGPYDPDYGRKRITDEQYERMKSSTSLAYKADKWLSSNLDSNESFDTLDDDRQRGEMFWFAYEDQTIGMWRVADMINSGVPVNKVVNLIENGNGFSSPKGNLDKDILGTEGDSLRFEMIEGNYNNALVNFAKECAKVKENKDEIKHYVTKGQKWGVRKYQNKDGSLTPAGREHYGYGNVSKSGLKDFAKKAAHTVSKGVGKVGEKAGEKVFGNDTNGVSKISKKMDDWGSGKKSERKKAFDESTRVTGKEEAEAWKRLADYYEAQQKNKKG